MALLAKHDINSKQRVLMVVAVKDEMTLRILPADRFTLHDRAGQIDLPGRRPGIPDDAQQQLGCLPADLAAVLPQGGQTWAEDLGQGDAVIPYQADILRDAQPHPLCLVVGAQRRVIIRAENAGGGLGQC